MYTLSFLYPRPRNRKFDYDYHRDVHLPLGIGLTVDTLGKRRIFLLASATPSHRQCESYSIHLA